MFAFSVWDHQEKCLTLGRDRLGEKPLYYGWQGNTFLFGSELKALKVHPAFNSEINRDELKFSKFVSKVRKRFNLMLLDLLKSELLLTKVLTKKEWQEIEQLIKEN